MYRTHARVTTPLGRRVLGQLCKHFAHKIPVEHEEARGRAAFPAGECRLFADDDGLDLTCEAASEDDLRRIEGIVAGHLERFLWRTPVAVIWERGA